MVLTKILFHHYPVKNKKNCKRSYFNFHKPIRDKVKKNCLFRVEMSVQKNFVSKFKIFFRDENEETAEKILKYVRGEIYKHRPDNLRYLILLNPTSGTGQSLRIYKKFKMLLSQANIGHSLIETEYRGHAAEIGNALE